MAAQGFLDGSCLGSGWLMVPYVKKHFEAWYTEGFGNANILKEVYSAVQSRCWGINERSEMYGALCTGRISRLLHAGGCVVSLVDQTKQLSGAASCRRAALK